MGNGDTGGASVGCRPTRSQPSLPAVRNGVVDLEEVRRNGIGATWKVVEDGAEVLFALLLQVALPALLVVLVSALLTTPPQLVAAAVAQLVVLASIGVVDVEHAVKDVPESDGALAFRATAPVLAFGVGHECLVVDLAEHAVWHAWRVVSQWYRRKWQGDQIVVGLEGDKECGLEVRNDYDVARLCGVCTVSARNCDSQNVIVVILLLLSLNAAAPLCGGASRHAVERARRQLAVWW